MASFWQTLSQPFIGLAPMDGITDHPYREIVTRHAKPDVIFTEFVNVEGLCHNAEQLLRPLLFTQRQRPIVAQLFGKTSESFRQAAILVAQLGFDGIDINMGCPAKKVAGAGAGAGLITQPRLVLEIIQATRQGMADWTSGATCKNCAEFSPEFCQQVQQQAVKRDIAKQPLPVSVKTRLGFDSLDLDWFKMLFQAQPEALTIHGRTLTQGYSGRADWQAIEQVAQLAKKLKVQTLIIGNGDVKSRSHGERLAGQHCLAGALIGRAACGNPLVFDPAYSESYPPEPSLLAKIALEHAQLFEQTFSNRPKYSFLPMRKHLAWYIKGVPQAKVVRQRLVRTSSSKEVETVLEERGRINCMK